MTSDIAAVFWKEWKEILTWGGTRSRFSLLILVGVLGILLPLQFGREWFGGLMPLVMWVWIPTYLVASTVADSVAGERERRTLETLLASRLPDSAILLGKLAAAVSYGVALSWIIMLIGAVTVNIAARGAGQVLFYAPDMLAAALGLSILGAGLAAGAGILVSLRASSVRQAQQTLSITMLLLLMAPVLLTRYLPPATAAQLAAIQAALKPLNVLLYLGGALLVADTLLILAALARFKRARLILD